MFSYSWQIANLRVIQRANLEIKKKVGSGMVALTGTNRRFHVIWAQNLWSELVNYELKVTVGFWHEVTKPTAIHGVMDVII